MNEVHIAAGRATLDGNLTIADGATALVLFAHGSGSSRHSPRNQFVARTLNDAGLATLLFDLLTPEGRRLICSPGNIASTSVCCQSVLFTRQNGHTRKSKPRICASVISDRVRAAAQRWLRRQSCRKMSERSCRVAVALTWRAKHYQEYRRRRCSSLAGATISSSS